MIACRPAILSVVLTTALAFPMLAASADAQTPEGLMEGFAIAWTAKDHAAIEAMLADDALYFSADQLLEGRDAVAASWRASMDATAEMIITPLRSGSEGDTAYHVGRWQLTREGVVIMEGVHTFIFRREHDGAWRIASAHVEDADPPPPAMTGLTGQFRVLLPEIALPPDQARKAGDWRIDYRGDGTLVVHHGEYEVLTGTHEVRGDRLIHHEERGPYACTVPGTYTWREVDGQVRFTAVEDTCVERVAVLTSRPWTPVR